MGRIKTQLIKRLTTELLREHKGEFAPSFDDNKPVVTRLLNQAASKKLRNAIAGYATRLTKEAARKAAAASRTAAPAPAAEPDQSPALAPAQEAQAA